MTVDEIMLAVRIALGRAPFTACTAADDSADGIVSVDEIVRAVHRLLDGCPPGNSALG